MGHMSRQERAGCFQNNMRQLWDIWDIASKMHRNHRRLKGLTTKWSQLSHILANWAIKGPGGS